MDVAGDGDELTLQFSRRHGRRESCVIVCYISTDKIFSPPR